MLPLMLTLIGNADVDSENQDLTSLSVFQTQFIYSDHDIRFIVTFVSGRYLLAKCLARFT